MSGFAVQSAAFSTAIHVGSVHRYGMSFAKKEDLTAQVFRAVADFVEQHHGGGAIIRIGDRVLDIDVRAAEVDQ